ncbi:lytic transglycosylase domain-containing protein [Desulfobacterales bacterium HSG2]|nr:lytic transglycosylase domain-containing protein [Desulfobacterales bacterium HSG2]
MFFILVSALPLSADIYRYIDKEGVMHFTNVPTSSRYHLYIKGRYSSNDYSSSYADWTTKYDHFITEASEMYDLSFPLLKAIIKVESNFNPRAISKKGAQGLMQLMPGTAKLVDVYNPFDPWQNIRGGARYLKMLMNRFDERLEWALAGYNAGPERVVRHKGIPPIKETRNYVKKVMEYYRVLKNR